MTRWHLIREDGWHAWRWRILTLWVIAFTALVALTLSNQHRQTQRAEDAAMAARTQNTEQQQLICAMREYIEGMYLITATSGTQPKDVLAARRAVITRFEGRMDGNCN